MIKEEGLRDWFGKSKSKDGKPGWVQSDGSPCANEPGEKGTPKCYSSAKKSSMSKKELRSADTRKSRQDPGQQQKSGAAKPTYVSTDKPKKKMKEETFNEAEDKKTKGSGTKDACYSKVKSRYSVWPSAYASGALVKCRKVGAANWGNSTKKEEFEGFYDLPEFTEIQIAAMKYAGIEVEVIDEACWKGYEKKGMKTMFGKKYPNCVKKEETEVQEDHKNPDSVKGIAKELDKAVEMHKSQAKRLRKSGVSEETVDEACWDTHEQRGMKKKGGKMVPNCVPKGSVNKEETEQVDEAAGGIIGGGMLALKALKTAKVVKGLSTAAKLGSAASALAPAVKVAGAGSGAGMAAAGAVGAAGGYGLAKATERKKQQQEEVTGGILVQDAGDFKPREIESVDIIKPEPIKGGQLQELMRTKVQTGNMYQVIFGWRGKMMMVKLFFPDATVPNRQKVADALNKMYPGSQLRSYSMSVVDYDDPYINVGEQTILEKKEEEKYCRLCEKRETRETCGYGPKMFDKFSVNNVSDSVKSSAASESDITEDINKKVEDRMQSDENRKRSLIRSKMRASRSKQKSDLQSEENIEEDMTGMSQKSGDKRSTDSGAGMTAKGVAKYNRRTGGNLKTAVTTPPSKLKAGSKAAGRRKSFCARSKSWKGERGLAARRRWNC